MKDVAACDKPREGGKQPLIRGFPNGEIQLRLYATSPNAGIVTEVFAAFLKAKRPAGIRAKLGINIGIGTANLGKWNILVPRGKENNFIPLVVANEKGEAQTEHSTCWVLGVVG